MNNNSFSSEEIAFGVIRKIRVKKFGIEGRDSKKVFESTSDLYKELDFSCDDVIVLNSERGILRGMHFQSANPQKKFIYLISGKLYLVIVDIRNDSVHFGEWTSLTVGSEEGYGVLIPEGFALGTLALQNSTFLMLCSGYYFEGNDFGFIYNDSSLGIIWPLDDGEIRISDRDLLLPSFLEACGGKNGRQNSNS